MHCSSLSFFMHFQLSHAETSPKIIEVLNWLCYVIVANISIIILFVSLYNLQLNTFPSVLIACSNIKQIRVGAAVNYFQLAYTLTLV